MLQPQMMMRRSDAWSMIGCFIPRRSLSPLRQRRRDKSYLSHSAPIHIDDAQQSLGEEAGKIVPISNASFHTGQGRTLYMVINVFRNVLLMSSFQLPHFLSELQGWPTGRRSKSAGQECVNDVIHWSPGVSYHHPCSSVETPTNI